MPESNVYITRAAGGLGIPSGSQDGVAGLVMNGGTAAPAGLAFNETKNYNSIAAIEADGITSAYDTAQGVLCWYHCSEYFRLNPGGKLWLQLAVETVTQQAMISTNAPTLLNAANGEVRLLAVARNPQPGYTATITSGMDSDTLAAIPLAEALAVAERANKRPIHIILEGRSKTGSASASLDLRSLNATSVTAVWAQDPAITAANPTRYTGHSAVGTFLGTLCSGSVEQNPACPGIFNTVESSAPPRFASIQIAGTPYASFTTADHSTLYDKGYVYLKPFVDISGVYWNNDATCGAATSDYYCLPNNRVINKAEREVYKALVPLLNRAVTLNANGTLPKEQIAVYRSKVDAVLDSMRSAEEISNYASYIDPAQNLAVTPNLQIQIRVQPVGYSRIITVNIGLVAVV